MIKFKLTCKYDDKYIIKVNNKKIKVTKEKSQIFQYIDNYSELPDSQTYEVNIKRRLHICLFNSFFNIFNALGLGDRKNYSKINNKIFFNVINNMNTNSGEIHVIANIKEDIVINEIIVSGSVSLLK
jgi:hypothetical protein